MSSAHFHLLSGHFPFVASALALLLLLVLLLRRADRGLLLATTILLVIAGGTAIASNVSGTPAEESVVSRPGIDETYIPSHEIRADFATLSAGLSALAALLVWILSRRGPAPVSALALIALFLLTLITVGLLAWTGLAGGRIRHAELRSALQAGVSAGSPAELST